MAQQNKSILPFGPSKCVRVVFEYYPPWQFDPPPPRDPETDFEGFSKYVFELVFKKLNYCYTTRKNYHHLMGVMLPNGTWRGIVGNITRNEADISGMITTSHLRNQFTDASYPFYFEDQRLMYKPLGLETDLAGFVKPFSLQLWILLFCTCVSLIPILLAIFHMGDYIDKFRNIARDETESTSSRNIKIIDEALKWSFMPLLSQSLWIIPERNSKRLVLAFWLIAVFIMNTLYRSTLNAMLIVPRIKIPFDSIEEYVRGDFKIPLAIAYGGVLDEYLKYAKDGTLAAEAYKKVKFYENNAVPIAVNVLAGKYTFALQTRTCMTIVGMGYKTTGKCIYLTKEGFLSGAPVVYLFPKGSKLRKKFDDVAMWLQDTGIAQKIEKELFKDAQICLNRDINKEIRGQLQPLKLGHFYGVFLLYFGGIAVSFVFFVAELLIARADSSRFRSI